MYQTKRLFGLSLPYFNITVNKILSDSALIIILLLYQNKARLNFGTLGINFGTLESAENDTKLPKNYTFSKRT